MSKPITPPKSPIVEWLTKVRVLHQEPFTVEPLAGDGSTRTFYRVHLKNRTLCLLSDPGWDLSRDYAPHQGYLETHGIPVPKFLEVDSEAGFLLMEDLGDRLLQSEIREVPGSQRQWLERSVELLAKLHGKTYPVPRHLPVAGRSFDGEKYSAELGFTLEHLYAGFLGWPRHTAAALQDFCTHIARLGPRVFCHRDYHTRNILLKDGALYLIDFQDARMGSPHYDLASLLYDAYISLSASERDALSALYRKHLEKFPVGKLVDWDHFELDLRAVAFQRVLKAAGSFASFYTRYSKKLHLPYLVPALETALALTQEVDELMPLAKVFALEECIARTKTRLQSV